MFVSIYCGTFLIWENAKMVPAGMAIATVSTQPCRVGEVAQVYLALFTEISKKAKLSTHSCKLE